MLVAAPAWANYPPGDDAGVGGVSSGGGGVGGVSDGGVGSSGSGLPDTGFDFTVLWLGLAVLLVGIALLVTTRRQPAIEKT